jgi:hypothetical protein
MATTIVTKNGSGAPTDSDLVAGELAVDLTNGRLYTTDLDSGGTVLELGTNPASDVTFGDNTKAIFGAGSDLQIYHDASDSIINDNGTGSLKLQQGGSTKLEVTATGVDVTGTVTADGLTVDTDTLVVDATNNRVGIGTTTITSGFKMEVIGDARFGDAVGDDAVELGWSAGGPEGFIQAYDRGASAFRPLNINNSLKVDASGNVGIGTGSPNGNGILTLNTPTDNSPQIVFSENDTGKWLIGHRHDGDYFRFYDLANSAERMRIDASGNVGIGAVPPSSQVSFIRNVQIEGLQAYGHTGIDDWGGFFTNSYIDAAGVRKYISSSQYAHNLHFDNNGAFIYYNAPNTNSAGDTVPFEERMRIDASGNLLVGMTSDNYLAADDGVQIKPEGNIRIGGAGTGARSVMAFVNDTAGTPAQVGSIQTSGSATTYATSSDQRLKDNIVDAPSASDDIDAIQVRSFDWKVDGSHQKYGMVAQELQSVAPEAVSATEDPEEMMGVDYSKLVPMLVKEIQSLRARVAQLES